MIGIVLSRADSASVHICEQLRGLESWREEYDDSRSDADGGGTVYRLDGAELREFEELHTHLDGVDSAFSDIDLLVFASRHAGETGPLLTAHPTGNFGPAEFGGYDRSLAQAAPSAQSTALAALTEHAPDGYDVGLEGTHHGPTELTTPSLFVELGSDEPQWNDPKGARAVARAILALRGVDPYDEKTLVGFGGGHYVPRFERVVRDTAWSVGHIGVDWALAAMGAPQEHHSVLRQAFERSETSYALIENNPALERTIEELGYRTVSETWVRETDGVPLALVNHLERSVRPITDGLRFGDRCPSTDAVSAECASIDYDGLSQIKIPADLLAAANGIDHERTLSTVRSRAVAVTTTENGTKLDQPVVVPPTVDRNHLTEAFITILQRKYDIERDGETVIAHEEAFSPALARQHGVPEGPAFGRLSNGQAVEVNDTIVTPDDVRERKTHMFSSI
ncbi:D-aminoacyl-tRNA deacylase [Halocatena pleomorpha]|uniref:D-aminoacyl-tRNA deacylase n=1 Tax=Halocatena pleomorpha TaxID=1785090 RepID=A0A3P3RC53_9EURY|nr:D-aminoacyl-tRNA deacylase [Halocatena pleomorpha]RRJ30894.1 hypothetical protein EIK79_08730 [Halocatena pleomorpha]